MRDVDVSKLLSLVLRHRPETVGVELDNAGWVQVQVLLEAMQSSGYEVDRGQLERVVAESPKQRFALDRTTGRIRANQGHSVAVELGLAPAIPPGTLFHGTPLTNLDSIYEHGLRRGRRHAVHLSADRRTARQVGGRRGAAAVLSVDSGGMYRDGVEFTVAANGVWLVDSVPTSYLTLTSSEDGQEHDVGDQ